MKSLFSASLAEKLPMVKVVRSEIQYQELTERNHMNRAIGLACLVGGIVLLILGFQQSHSFASNVSKTFTGNPTNNAMWMIVGGAVIAVFGLVLSLRGGSGTRT
ncbi:MAG TPA: DUF3185 family protein [Verrucomicrobiae bacterium]|nr:DUF3185 family protein [Verrucomicrobiae bacterium]